MSFRFAHPIAVAGLYSAVLLLAILVLTLNGGIIIPALPTLTPAECANVASDGCNNYVQLDVARSTKLSAWASIISALISFLAFGGLIISLREAIEANAMVTNVQRPWVSTKAKIKSDLSIGRKWIILRFNVTLENHGATPAQDLRIFFAYDCLPVGEKPSFNRPLNLRADRFLLMPGEKKDIHVRFRCRPPPIGSEFDLALVLKVDYAFTQKPRVGHTCSAFVVSKQEADGSRTPLRRENLRASSLVLDPSSDEGR